MRKAKLCYSFIVAVTVFFSVNIVNGEVGDVINRALCREQLQWVLSSDHSELQITGNGSMCNYSEPSEVPWHDYVSSIQTVSIGEGVSSIGDYAFHECTSLKSVSIPESVFSIGRNAFSHCELIESVAIPENVVSIGYEAFYRCYSLNSVTIPSSVASIEDRAFYGISKLSSFNVSSANKHFASVSGVLLSYDNTVLVQYPPGMITTVYSIPDSVKAIRNFSFSYSGLKEIIIPDGVSSIGSFAFSYCSDLERITVPKSVEFLGGSLCVGCTNLKSIEINDGNPHFKSIDGVLFNGDYSILLQYPVGSNNSSYTIPSTVKRISDHAFHSSSLVNVTISANVESMGDAFYLCRHLSSIDVDEGNSWFKSIDGVLFNHDGTLLVQYPSNKTDTNYIIPDNVTTIKSYAFNYCSSIVNVTIPDSVKTIHQNAFEECKNLSFVFYQGSIIASAGNAFHSNGPSITVCVSPFYTSNIFCGMDVSNTSVCEEFQSFFSHCYKATFIDGEFFQERMVDVVKWEYQTNGCINYQCFNDTGKVAWSLCNNTENETHICIDGKCGNSSSSYGWTIDIEVDNKKPDEVNMDEMLEYLGQIDSDNITIGLEMNDQGEVVHVFVFVDSKEKANKIASKMMECVDNDSPSDNHATN